MRELAIAYGNNRQAKKWVNKTISYDDLKARLKVTIRTTESAEEYAKMSKAQRDSAKDHGGFVGGVLKGGRRKVDTVELRSMIALDGDRIDKAFLDNYESNAPYASCLYTTHSSTPDHPRVRLRIADEDRISFTKFARDSVSYAVASRFKLDYPMDNELLRENFQRLGSISLMSLGETVSDISGKIIDETIQKSKELELQKEVLRDKEAGYNRIKEELEKGDNNVLRRDDQERNENERVLRNGEYGRDNRENQGEYTKQLGGTDRLHLKIRMDMMRLTLPLTERDIDTVLINGGNHDGSRLPLIAEFSKGKSNEELGEYLKDTFRDGNGFYIDEREVSSWYSDKGIHLAYGTSARKDDTQILSWSDAASRINELLDSGEFATNVELSEAIDYERNRISESLWYLTHDLSEEGQAQGYFELLKTSGGGFPEETKRLSEALKNPEYLKETIKEYNRFLEGYKENRDVLKFHYHKVDSLYQRLQELELPRKE